jgi:hypothetical protein
LTAPAGCADGLVMSGRGPPDAGVKGAHAAALLGFRLLRVWNPIEGGGTTCAG